MSYAMLKKLEELIDELKALIGEVQDSPTSYTLLWRIKVLEGYLDTVEALLTKATTPTIYNVDITTLDTEYSQALPANCKKFTMHTRDGTAFRLAFVTGKVATPTEPYFTHRQGIAYYEDNLLLTGITLYFACDVGSKEMEIIAWA